MEYSHLFIVPCITAIFIFLERKKIFAAATYSFGTGGVITAIGFALFTAAQVFRYALNENDYLSCMLLGFIAAWNGLFILFYGKESVRRDLFPFLFLICMVPIPSWVLQNIVAALQRGSAEAANIIFFLLRVPYLRDDLVFHLTSVSIRVADECSGIRSSIALFIMGAVLGHMFLNTQWKKALLIVSVFPITVFKNGVRIVTLGLLGEYISMDYLTKSYLHKGGGKFFFILGLALLLLLVFCINSFDTLSSKRKKQRAASKP